MAEGNLTLEDLTKAIQKACTERNIRLGNEGAFYNPLDEPTSCQFDMEAFQRSAAAIARNRERTAALMRAAKPLPSANINLGVSSSSVEDPAPSSPIAEPQLLGSSPALSTMTPRCAPEPPASVLTTVGANPMLQSYATPSNVAQPTQGQRPAAHNFTSIPTQSQHWQADSTAFSEPHSTFQQQSSQPSVAQSTHGQRSAAHDPLSIPVLRFVMICHDLFFVSGGRFLLCSCRVKSGLAK